jgi:hypothetical protein
MSDFNPVRRTLSPPRVASPAPGLSLAPMSRRGAGRPMPALDRRQRTSGHGKPATTLLRARAPDLSTWLERPARPAPARERLVLAGRPLRRNGPIGTRQGKYRGHDGCGCSHRDIALFFSPYPRIFFDHETEENPDEHGPI